MTIFPAGQSFSLNQGRPLYTGNRSAEIIYTTLTDSRARDLILKAHTRYIFDSTLSGSLTSGQIYFFDSLSTEKITYRDDLIGMPIINGMKMRSASDAFTVRNVDANESFTLER